MDFLCKCCGHRNRGIEPEYDGKQEQKYFEIVEKINKCMDVYETTRKQKWFRVKWFLSSSWAYRQFREFVFKEFPELNQEIFKDIDSLILRLITLESKERWNYKITCKNCHKKVVTFWLEH